MYQAQFISAFVLYYAFSKEEHTLDSYDAAQNQNMHNAFKT